jgi:hypothetical protein
LCLQKLKLELLTPPEQILSTPVLRYRVNFPFQNVLPKITQITFNGKIFCYGPGEPGEFLFFFIYLSSMSVRK